MKKRKLVILPGGGDPENEKYKSVYDVILDFAKKLSYGEITIQRWRGHHSCSEKGFINMIDATESAVSLFQKLEENDAGYDVICRSFGTGVFLNACQKLDLRRIGFASLWGVPSYTAFYELFKEQIIASMKSAKNKGLDIDETFFESVIPYELLLSRFDGSFRVNVINGSDDIYSPPSFHKFLNESIKNNNLHFTLISDLPHEAPYYHQEYLDKVFSRSYS